MKKDAMVLVLCACVVCAALVKARLAHGLKLQETAARCNV